MKMAIEKVTVKMKGGNIEVDQFTDIPSAIEYFTVRDENGHIRTNGETQFLQLINCRHKYNRKNEARYAQRPLSLKRLGHLIKADPKFRAGLNVLLSEFDEPRLKE